MVIPCCYAGVIQSIKDGGPWAARRYTVFFPIDGDKQYVRLILLHLLYFKATSTVGANQPLNEF